MEIGYGATFDPQNLRYKCCCSTVHVTTGAQVIGALEAIGIVGGIIMACVDVSKLGGYTSVNWVSAAVWAIVVILLFYGINKDKPGMLIPHLVLQGMGIVGLVVVAIISVVLVVEGSTFVVELVNMNANNVNIDDIQHYITIIGCVLITCFLTAALFQIWFMVVVLRAYKYITDKNSCAFMTKSPQSMYSPPPYGYAPPIQPYTPTPQY